MNIVMLISLLTFLVKITFTPHMFSKLVRNFKVCLFVCLFVFFFMMCQSALLYQCQLIEKKTFRRLSIIFFKWHAIDYATDLHISPSHEIPRTRGRRTFITRSGVLQFRNTCFASGCLRFLDTQLAVDFMLKPLNERVHVINRKGYDSGIVHSHFSAHLRVNQYYM